MPETLINPIALPEGIACGFSLSFPPEKDNVGPYMRYLRHFSPYHVSLFQHHGTHVHRVLRQGLAYTAEGDALVTTHENVVLGVKTADCVPLLWFDRKAGVIAASHVGWRGLCLGIVETTWNAMQALGAQSSRIHTIVGPHISFRNFLIQENVRRAILHDHTYFSPFFRTRPFGYQFDLGKAVEYQLKKKGIIYRHTLAIDTYEDKRFNSYRRATHLGTMQNYRPQISWILQSHAF